MTKIEPEPPPPPEPHVLAGDPEGDGLGERVPFYLTTSHGAEAIFAAGIPELWLAEAPGGEMRWGERRARKAALALADGWASTILQRLAAEPLAAAELDRAIEGLSGRRIRACLKAMRASGQVEPEPGGDRNGARAWGGIDGWFRAVIECRLDGMTVAGDIDLAVAVLEALHERLFDRWLKT